MNWTRMGRSCRRLIDYNAGELNKLRCLFYTIVLQTGYLCWYTCGRRMVVDRCDDDAMKVDDEPSGSLRYFQGGRSFRPFGLSSLKMLRDNFHS